MMLVEYFFYQFMTLFWLYKLENPCGFSLSCDRRKCAVTQTAEYPPVFNDVLVKKGTHRMSVFNQNETCFQCKHLKDNVFISTAQIFQKVLIPLASNCP